MQVKSEIFRMKMSLFQVTTFLWLVFHQNLSVLYHIPAKIGNFSKIRAETKSPDLAVFASLKHTDPP